MKRHIDELDEAVEFVEAVRKSGGMMRGGYEKYAEHCPEFTTTNLRTLFLFDR